MPSPSLKAYDGIGASGSFVRGLRGDALIKATQRGGVQTKPRRERAPERLSPNAGGSSQSDEGKGVSSTPP